MAITIRRLTACLRGSRFLQAALLAGMCWGTVADAAPVTFRFDAEIVGVSPGSPFDLALAYEVGDTIHGKFTFQPTSGADSDYSIVAAQAFALEFDINGKVVGSSGYGIVVLDDTVIDDSPFQGTLDTMRVGCSEPSCIPDYVDLGVGEPFRVRSRMQLIGVSSIFAAPEINDDPATWNAFALRRSLSLNFDSEGPGAMGFHATVGDFRIVPEPGSLGLVVSALIVAAVFSLTGWRNRCR